MLVSTTLLYKKKKNPVDQNIENCPGLLTFLKGLREKAHTTDHIYDGLLRQRSSSRILEDFPRGQIPTDLRESINQILNFHLYFFLKLDWMRHYFPCPSLPSLTPPEP